MREEIGPLRTGSPRCVCRGLGSAVGRELGELRGSGGRSLWCFFVLMVGGPDWEQGTSFPAVLDQGNMEMPPSSSLAQLCSWIFLWLSVLGWKEGSACPFAHWLALCSLFLIIFCDTEESPSFPMDFPNKIMTGVIYIKLQE